MTESPQWIPIEPADDDFAWWREHPASRVAAPQDLPTEPSGEVGPRCRLRPIYTSGALSIT